jgi:multicomponent Na+:H+ antiporter subunit B
MRAQLIPRIAAKIMIPPILIFAFYVHFHGDYGPGGGFQAGVILAAGVILYALIFGLQQARRAIPLALVVTLSALGFMIFAGTGIVSLLLGGDYLEYNVLAHDPIHGQHRGILWVEMGVVTTVFGVMVSLFYAFAMRGRRRG